MGAFGILSVRNSFQATQSLYQDRVLNIQRIGDVSGALGGTFRAAITKMDEGEYTADEGIAKMVTALQLIERQWALVQTQKATPQERLLRLHCDTLLVSAKEQIQTTIEALQVMKAESGGLLSNQVGMLSSSLAPSIEVILPVLDSLTQTQLQEAKKSFQSTTQSYTATIVLYGLIAVFCLLIVVGIGILLFRQITGQLNAILPVLASIGEGKLQERIPIRNQDELSAIARESNHMADSITLMVGNFQHATASIAHTSDSLTEASQQVEVDSTKAMVQNQKSVESVRTMIHQMEQVEHSSQVLHSSTTDLSRQSDHLSAEIKSIATLCEDEVHEVHEAQLRTDAVIDKISILEKTTAQISQINSMISKIAIQTNLLALNATIEAASAGPAGAGFAVVANEVKALARQSASAAQTIKTNIATLSEVTVQTVQETKEIIQSIDTIHMKSRSISETVQSLQNSMQMTNSLVVHSQHATTSIQDIIKATLDSLQDISGNMKLAQDSTKNNLVGVQTIRGQIQEMTHMTEQLSESVQQFTGHI